MPIIKRYSKVSLSMLLTGLVLFLNGCTTGYFDPAYQSPNARSVSKVPEISRHTKPRPRYTPPRKAKVKPYTPRVRKYSVNKANPADAVITQKEMASVAPEILSEQAKQRSTVDIDPYASIPTSNDKGRKPVTTGSSSSPAVKSLLIRAQADLAIGKSGSAVSKLERGLRIESENPKLWNLLAKAHFDQSNYQQAISMSKKSIRYSSNDSLIAKNWSLIKKAGLRSGDTTVVKEANNYFKLNP